MDNFDLKTAENNAADKRYDEIPVFKQGIAIVRRYGKFGAVMVGGKEIVPPIYDGLSEFKDGYAVAKWNNEERVVNLSGQIRVLKDDKEIFLPEDYDWGFDFIEDICVVVKNGKSGFVNTQLELLLPCEYEHVEPLNDCIFKFKKEKKWGAVDKYGNVIAEADYVSIVCEAETLLVVEIHVPNGSITESRYGLLDCLGNVILPAKCRAITRIDHGNDIFFIVEKDGAKGVLNKNGKTVVPFLYGQISISGSCFQCSCHRYGDICGVYNFHGEHFLNIDDGHNVIIPTDYELAQYVGYGLIKVSKDCKWGLIDFSGKIVIEPQYACIDKFDGSFARVGISLDEQKCTSLGNCWNNDRFRYGLIDMSGDVALPVEYERIEKWDNDYYVVRKE